MAEKCSMLEDDDSGGEVNQVQSIPIFVGYKLPDWITVELLLQHFSSFEDKIDKSRSTIINTPGNRHGKLFFTDNNATSQAIENLNNSSLKYQGDTFKISVNQWVWKAKDSTGPIRHDHVKKKHQDILLVVTKPQKSETTAWVGENLPEYVTEFQLKNHFREVRNQIEKVTFKQTKSSTRVAYVKFSTAESCNLAVSKYDKTLLQMSSHKMKGSKTESASNTGRGLDNEHAIVFDENDEKQAEMDEIPEMEVHPDTSGTDIVDLLHSFSEHKVKNPDADSDTYSIASSASSSVSSTATAWVGYDLPKNVTESLLRKHFREVNDQITHIMFHVTKKKTRIAYIEFSSVGACEQAVITYNLTELKGGQEIWVSKKGEKPAKEKHDVKRPDSEASIVLRHLPSAVDDNLLRTICSKYGTVLSLRRDQPESALVTFSSTDSATTAVREVNGMQLGGACIQAQPLRMPYVQPHSPQRPNSPTYQQPPFLGFPAGGNPYQQPPRTDYLSHGSGHQPPGSYQQPSGPYQQPARPYQQPPGPYQQPPGPYQQPPGPYQQLPGPYQQPPGPYQQVLSPQTPGPTHEYDMPGVLHHFFTGRFGNEIKAAEKKGIKFNFVNDSLFVEGVESDCQEFFRSCIEPLKDGSVQLTADQWNQLVTAKKDGTLFQNIAKPFQHNPNVHIDKREDPFTLVIVGFKDAVDSARESFMSKLDKKILVDKFKLSVLTQLQPDLCDAIQSECDVLVQGFHSGSSELALEGENGDFPRARTKLLAEIHAVIVRKAQSISSSDIPSLQHFVRSRNLNVVLCTVGSKGVPQFDLDEVILGEESQVVLKVCGARHDVGVVVNLSQKGPRSFTVNGVSESQYAYLTGQSEYSPGVIQKDHGISMQYASEKQQIIIRGFNFVSLKSVQGLLIAAVKQHSVQIVNFQCSKDEGIFLCHILFHEQIELGMLLLEELQEKYNTKLLQIKGRLKLSGPNSEVENATKLVRERLLQGFQQKDFEFTLNTSLKRDLEQTIEMLERADLVKIVKTSSDHGSVPKHEMKINVSVLSNSDKAFESTCQQLKELDPATRSIKLKEEEKKVLSEEVISSLKEAHHVHIRGVKDPLLYFIHGLRKVDVDQAFSAMKDHFADIVSITYTMKITHLQAMFLEKKRRKEIDAMDAEVKIRKQYHGKKDGDAVVTITGLRSPVESCKLELNLLLQKYVEQRVSWEDSGSKYHWYRERKEAVVAEVEAECDVLVHFESNCSASVCGIEEDAIAKAKEIVQECTEMVRCSIKASKEQRIKVGMSMKENKFKHSLVAIDTFDSAGILLYAPIRFNSLVVDVEEEIDSFLSKASHDRQDVSLDPLMSTIIHARYLKKGTEGCKVIFRKEKPGVLIVTGKRDAVQSLVARIQGIIADLQPTFCSQKVVVDKCFQSLLVQQSTYFFMKGIERSHFVEIRLPTGSENETKWAAEVKPIGWSKQCSVKIVQGSLVKERADALVNQANEDLKLLSGLSRALVKAGGDSIQSECDSYVVKNGKVPTGEAVCLGSGKLPCKRIIHAVPPRWRGGSHGETALLEQSFIRSMDVAADNNCQRIALPALGTGVLHFPMDKCAECSMSALVKALSKHPDGFKDIKFVLFTEDDVSAFITIFQALETVPDLNCKVVEISQSDDIPKSTSAELPACQWDYMNDDQKFLPFEAALNTQLEQEYSRNPNSKFAYKHSKWRYEADFSAMTQTNLDTGKVRTIRRSVHTTASWYWKDDNGTFRPYTHSISVEIGRILSENAVNCIHIDGRDYKFDFINKYQINTSTGHKREIKVSRNGDSEASVAGLSITVKGCEEDVLASKKKVMEYFKKQEKEDKWQIPRIFLSKMEPMIHNSCARYSVKVSFEDASKDNVQVLLHGWEKSVALVKEQCAGELLNLTTAQAHAGVVKTPDEWEEDGSSSVLKVVQNGSAEYNKVLDRMRETVPNVEIVKLERIQNEWLWEKFSQHRDRIQKKNQGVVRENDLFHGTRSTDPRFIYEGEEGFDMRFSQAGMWGNGNYFAVNASYSVNYSHPVSGGLRQMFLVRVVIGEAHDCPPNGSLRLPPEKPKTSSLFIVERYDSVTGNTGGSRVYIIYDNVKAYPLYLITFK